MKIALTKQCKKELELLHKNQPNYAKLVVLKMKDISNGTVPHDKLKGYEGLYKSRVGMLRIGYSIRGDEVVFWMVKKRGEAYNRSDLRKVRGMMYKIQ